MTELKQEIEFEKKFLKQFKDFKCKNCCESGCGDGDFHDHELIKEVLKRYKEQRINDVINWIVSNEQTIEAKVFGNRINKLIGVK
jgi:hypothetical protein